MLTKISELREREIVNILDGRRLGPADDLEIDVETGMIKALVVLGSSGFLGLFGRNDEIIIPWERIQKIGVDVVLVDLNGLENSSEILL